MSEIPPGAHLFQVPPSLQPPAKTERLITFKNCKIGYVVHVDSTNKVTGYEMQILDQQEETTYVFRFDQALRDVFLDMLVALPDVGTVPGGDNGHAA